MRTYNIQAMDELMRVMAEAHVSESVIESIRDRFAVLDADLKEFLSDLSLMFDDQKRWRLC